MSKQVSRATGLDPKKVSGELFTLTYGSLVAQLISDYEEDDVVNRELDKIGYNMGVRLIDDFLAKNPTVGKCNDLREVADVLAKQGFKSYLGVVPSVSNWNASGDEFSLLLEQNPLTEFVELPPETGHRDLKFSQIICGAIRGALEMIHIEVASWFVQDQLRGDPQTEIRIKFVRRVEESVPSGDD